MKYFWLLFFILIAAQAEATTRYVDGNLGSTCSGSAYSIANRNCTGSDGPGYKTAQEAATAAVAGDIVYFRTGTYAPMVLAASGTSGSPITYRKYASESPAFFTASTTAQNVDFNGKSWIIFDGFTVEGGENAILVYPGSSNNQIINNTVHGAYRAGILVYGGSNDNLIDSNTVYDNSKVNWPRGTACGSFWTPGISVQSGSSRNTISNNRVYWNHGEGIVTGVGGGSNVIRKNVVADNWSVNIYTDGGTNETIAQNLSYVSADAKSWVGVATCGQGSNPLGIGAAVEPDSSFVSALSGLVITGNVVINSNSGFWAFPEQAGHVFSNWVIANNTFINNDNGIKIINSGAGVSNIIFKNNVVKGGANQIAGNPTFQIVPVPTSITFSNNIYHNGATSEFYWGGTSGTAFATWATNSGETNSSFADPLVVDATYVPPRLWDDAGLGAGAAVSTIDLENYGLTSTSTAIDAGAASVSALYTPAYNGSAPDMGAFERFTMSNCEVGEVATNKIVCNAAMNLNQPIQITNTTGWSWTGGTISSVAVTGNAQLTFTLSGAYGGGASTVSYNETTGNVRDSAIYGATLNNRMSALSAFTVTDNTGGAPAGSVGLSHWRVYLLQGSTDTSWVAKCGQDSTNCVVAPGSKLWIRGKLLNSSGSNYAAFNLLNKWRYNGGSYVALTDSYVNSIKVLGLGSQLGTVMSDGAATTADILTSGGTNVAGAVVRTTSSIPSVTLNNGQEVEFAQAIDISGLAVAGDTYEMCPFRDDGTALTCSTPIKLTIGSYQSVR